MLGVRAQRIGGSGREAVGIQGISRKLDDRAYPLVVGSLHHGVPVAGYRVGKQPAPVRVKGIQA